MLHRFLVRARSSIEPARDLRASFRARWLSTAVPAVPMLLVLAACTGSSPPTTWLVLPSDPPRTGAAAAPAASAPSAGAASPAPALVWTLLAPQLPEYLQREALLRPEADGSWRAWPATRWAEPLETGVARVLAADLARLLGPDRVRTRAAPAGLAPAGQVGVEFSALDIEPGLRSVKLAARWWPVPPPGAASGAPAGASPAGPVARTGGSVAFTVDAAGSDAASLARAHREALARLAEAIAVTLR